MHFTWTSFAEIIDDASVHMQTSAYNASVRLDSQCSLQSIPSVESLGFSGIKVRIPGAGASSSGTPTVDSATGRIVYPDGYIFNGVMGSAQWFIQTALRWFYLILLTRYSIWVWRSYNRQFNLDLFSFVTASKYANTLSIMMDLGGEEARFSCNVNIQSS